MYPRKVPEEALANIRTKTLVIDKHAALRALMKISFKKIEDVIMFGEIWQEGKNKFRAVLPIKGGKIAFVIFKEYPDFLEMKTCGVGKRKQMWG